MVGEVRLAVLAAVDARGVEVYIIREPHGDGEVVGGARRCWWQRSSGGGSVAGVGLAGKSGRGLLGGAGCHTG